MIGIVPIIRGKVVSLKFWPESVRKFLNGDKGPFTCKYYYLGFFWGPFIKMGIIGANINDFTKPVELISSKL